MNTQSAMRKSGMKPNIAQAASARDAFGHLEPVLAHQSLSGALANGQLKHPVVSRFLSRMKSEPGVSSSRGH
jgi:hypothetical protein